MVSPVVVTFAPNDRAETIELTNRADAPLRLEVHALAWNMQPDGDAPPDPARDIVVYPQLLTIAPHAARRIRVALVSPQTPSVEHAYRVELSEIPQFTGPNRAPGMALTFTTRMRLAVYVPPADAKRATSFAVPPMRDGKVSMTLTNDGNVHVRVRSIVVTGHGPSGEPSFSTTVDGGAVLAHSRRDFTADVPRAACPSTRTMSVTADLDGRATTQSLPVSPHACGP